MEPCFSPAAELRSVLQEVSWSMAACSLAEFRFRVGPLRGNVGLGTSQVTDTAFFPRKAGVGAASPPHHSTNRPTRPDANSDMAAISSQRYTGEHAEEGAVRQLWTPRPGKRLLVLRSPEVGIWTGALTGGNESLPLEAGTVLGYVRSLADDEPLRAPFRGRPARILALDGGPVGVGDPLILWEVMDE